MPSDRFAALATIVLTSSCVPAEDASLLIVDASLDADDTATTRDTGEPADDADAILSDTSEPADSLEPGPDSEDAGLIDADAVGGADTTPTMPSDADAPPPLCAVGTKRCSGNNAETCTGSAWTAEACTGATPRCASGACVTCETVDATKKTCAGACVDTKTDANNCGGCGTKCGTANTTASTCSAGACALTCVTNYADCDGNPANGCEANLLTDVDNCGACGYRVVAAGRTGEASQRTCVAGKPNPPWVPVSATAAPAYASPYVATWTGKRFLVVSGTTYAGYDPKSNAWSTVPAPSGPVTQELVEIPTLGKVFLWGGNYGTSSPAQIFDDSDASPKWISVTGSGAPSARYDTGVVYLERPTGTGTAHEVYVLLGSAGPSASSGRYDVDTGTWTTFSSDTSFAQCTHATAGACTRAYATFAATRGVIIGYGGQCSNGVSCHTQPALLRLTPSTLTWDSAPAAGGYSNRRGPTLLTVGDKVFYGGGYTSCGAHPTPCNVRQTWFLDPFVGGGEVLYPSKPDPAVDTAFEVFTGRAIFYWGGKQTSQDGLTVGVTGEGSIALAGSTPLVWRNLPTTGAPAARSAPRNGATTGNQQRAWTGSEVIVWGGANTSGTVSGGARYQPPVGCVCPKNADAPSTVQSPCAAVSKILDTTCNP